MTLDSVRVVGRGRVGTAVAARLKERGLLWAATDARDATDPADATATTAATDAALVLLCVPDGAINEVARTIAPGPWVAHVSGATPLSALDPHVRRFTVHPLQTFTRSRGAEQLDGAWAAVTADSPEGRTLGRGLADTLGLRPFDLADDRRVLYHCGAAIASNFLVTIHHAAARAVAQAGAPPEALVPLMRRTIENHFELTGPISRGDWGTVERHLRALQAELPDLEPMYRALVEATKP